MRYTRPMHEAGDDRARHVAQVRNYYEQNTARFERYGLGASSIHRAVWAPGVSTREGALHYVDELLVGAIAPSNSIPRVVDLGCGVGASLVYIARQREIIGEGITISPLQAKRAAEIIAQAGLEGRVRCREGNFLSLPADITGADLAFSIEAFVHSPDASLYFAQAAKVLKPGGRLVVCDDFLAAPIDGLAAGARRIVADFSRGWRAPSVLTTAQAGQEAGREGLRLVQDLDLTPHLDLRRPRDRLISLFVKVGRRLAFRGEYWHSLFGGDALQLGLTGGLLQYRFLMFERA
jgi:SAM-dependent methyltransferase